MKSEYLICLLVLIFGNSIVYSQTAYEPPLIEKDVCPFELCRLGQWVVKESINVFENEGDSTSIKFLLSENDTIIAILGNVHYERFGKVLITQAYYDFNINDTLIVLRCVEGEFIVYYKGKKIYTDIFWPIKYYETDNYEENYNTAKYFGKMIERPQFTWWVKISKNNNEGWIRLRNLTPYCSNFKEKIDGMGY